MFSKDNMGIEEEDFNKGLLGKDFIKASSLSIPEAYLALEREQRKANFRPNEIFNKTFEYLNRFNKYSNKDVVISIRSILDEYKMEEFEASALWNLCPESVEAAKILIY